MDGMIHARTAEFGIPLFLFEPARLKFFSSFQPGLIKPTLGNSFPNAPPAVAWASLFKPQEFEDKIELELG